MGVARRPGLAHLNEVNRQAARLGAGKQQTGGAGESATAGRRYVETGGAGQRVKRLNRNLNQFAEPFAQFVAGPGDVKSLERRRGPLVRAYTVKLRRTSRSKAGADRQRSRQQQLLAAQHAELRPAFADHDDRNSVIGFFARRCSRHRLA